MEYVKISAILVVQLSLIATFSVKTSSKSQLTLNSIFEIQIQPNLSEPTLAILVGDTMLIQITDNIGLIKQREIFYYGIKDTIENEIKGDYMNIKRWEVNYNDSSINLFIIFHKNSNFHLFEIYFIDAPSKEILKKKIKNLRLAKRIYKRTIELFHPPTLSFTVNSVLGAHSQWEINDTIIAICRAFDGIPNEIPKFENYQRFSNISSTFSLERNERMINMTVGTENHMNPLQCRAGSEVKVHTIKVFHHPTELFIKPKLKLVHSNTTFQCYAKDGFPTPTMEWFLVEGPANPSNYYELPGNRSYLFIKDNCPNHSKWKFKCKLTHMIRNSSRTLVKMISFFFENNTIGQCNLDCLHVRLLEAEYSMKKTDQSACDVKSNLLDILFLKKEVSSIREHIYQFKKDFIISIAQSKLEDKILHSRINLLKNETFLSNSLLFSMLPANKSAIDPNPYGNFLKERNVSIDDFIQIDKSLDAFKQLPWKEISQLSKHLKEITNNYQTNVKIIKLERNLIRNLSHIQNDFRRKYDLLKLENTALKYRLELLRSRNNEMNKAFLLKMTNFEKKLAKIPEMSKFLYIKSL